MPTVSDLILFILKHEEYVDAMGIVKMTMTDKRNVVENTCLFYNISRLEETLKYGLGFSVR